MPRASWRLQQNLTLTSGRRWLSLSSQEFYDTDTMNMKRSSTARLQSLEQGDLFYKRGDHSSAGKVTPKEPGLRAGQFSGSAWVSPHPRPHPSIPHPAESDPPCGLPHRSHSPRLSFLPLYQQVTFLPQELGEEGSDWGGREVAKPPLPGLSDLAFLDLQPWFPLSQRRTAMC